MQICTFRETLWARQIQTWSALFLEHSSFLISMFLKKNPERKVPHPGKNTLKLRCSKQKSDLWLTQLKFYQTDDREIRSMDFILWISPTHRRQDVTLRIYEEGNKVSVSSESDTVKVVRSNIVSHHLQRSHFHRPTIRSFSLFECKFATIINGFSLLPSRGTLLSSQSNYSRRRQTTTSTETTLFYSHERHRVLFYQFPLLLPPNFTLFKNYFLRHSKNSFRLTLTW